MQRQGARFVLTVEDDGSGLSPEDRARVGMRGERLDESVPGSGLGLAIVRDISKLYAGFLELDASALGGLEARLTLPASAVISKAALTIPPLIWAVETAPLCV